MRILFIGGTSFVGRAMAESAHRAGHDITLLHRGQSGPDLFPEATHLLADRNGDLQVLAEGQWDATIDVSAYVPRQVRSLAEALGGRGGHHVYISTCSVYAEPTAPGITEDAPLLEPPAPEVEEVSGQTYGALKVACELAAAQAYGDTLTIVRPTYVIGPHDPTGRFPWWVLRMARGGRVLCPGPTESPFQVIDARDLGEWTIRLVENKTYGTFNGARPSFSWGELLTTTASVAGGPETQLEWVDGQWLERDGVTRMNLPLWSGVEPAWVFATDVSRSEEVGLKHGSLQDTVRDTLSWAMESDQDAVLNPAWGISAEREAELLAGWDAQRS